MTHDPSKIALRKKSPKGLHRHGATSSTTNRHAPRRAAPGRSRDRLRPSTESRITANVVVAEIFDGDSRSRGEGVPPQRYGESIDMVDRDGPLHNETYVGRVLRLTLLTPKIVEAMQDGRQAPEITPPVLTMPFPVE